VVAVSLVTGAAGVLVARERVARAVVARVQAKRVEAVARARHLVERVHLETAAFELWTS